MVYLTYKIIGSDTISLFIAVSLFSFQCLPVESVIGGGHSNITDVPWLASIQESKDGVSNFSHHCGGTIYSPDIIITAAHCFFKKTWANKMVRHHIKNFRVRAGVTNWDDEGGQTRQILKITIHPNYNTRNLNNDIVLIRLSSPILLNQRKFPAIKMNIPPDEKKLPKLYSEFNKLFTKGIGIVSGWGYTDADTANKNAHVLEYYPKRLKIALVDLVDFPTCHDLIQEKIGKTAADITDVNVCAWSQKGYDTCQGDSGGGLICRRARSKFLCGIVSGGYGCGSTEYPAFYTNVAKFSSWIDKTAKDLMQS